MAGLQVIHAGIGAPLGRVLVHQRFDAEACIFKVGFQAEVTGDRAGSRGKRKRRSVEAVKDRLHPEPVAAQSECLCQPVKDRKCEHAIESLDRAWTPLLEGFDQDFAVGLTAEFVAERD